MGVLAALLVVVAALAVGLGVGLTRGGDGPSAQVATTPAPSTPTPTTTPTPTPAASTPAATAPSTPAPTPPTKAAGTPPPPPLLAFTVVKDSWIAVTDSKGDQLVARVWHSGEKASYDGPAFTVRTGNAGGVRFVVDGKPRPVGKPGQVVSFTVRG